MRTQSRWCPFRKRRQCIWERRDRGIYSISGGRSLYWLHFNFGQFMIPEAYPWIFVQVQLDWLSNVSLYQTFSVNASFLYQAVGTQANDDKRQQILSIWPFNLKGVLATFACVPTAWYKKDAFTGNVWYKLRLLSRPSCTRTNIQEYASGLMNWPEPKYKQYNFSPPADIMDTTITPLWEWCILVIQWRFSWTERPTQSMLI